jgi:hypothetical protein
MYGETRTLFQIDGGDNIDLAATQVPYLYTLERSPPYFQRLMADSDFNQACSLAPEFHVETTGCGFALQQPPSNIALCTGVA